MRMNGMDSLPKPIPPTEEMIRIREEMQQAENDGREEESIRLFSLYMNMRRAQVVG